MFISDTPFPTVSPAATVLPCLSDDCRATRAYSASVSLRASWAATEAAAAFFRVPGPVLQQALRAALAATIIPSGVAFFC
jgi:hypothetical protein